MAIARGQRLISQLASTGGDGSGTSDAIGDYSDAGAITLRVTPGTNDAYSLSRAMVSIEDGATFSATDYGGISALSVGITCDVSDAGGVLYALTAFAITSNGDWKSHCYDFDPETIGSGNIVGVARWTFSKTGAPVILDGSRGQFLQFSLNDDFTGLVHHRFVVQGYYLDEKI